MTQDVMIHETTLLTFKFMSASAVLKFDEGRTSALLHDVHAHIPRRGHATSLLGAVTEYADIYKIDLWLKAQRSGDPHFGMSNEQLVEFYEKFGFIPQKDTKPVMMIRYYSR